MPCSGFVIGAGWASASVIASGSRADREAFGVSVGEGGDEASAAADCAPACADGVSVGCGLLCTAIPEPSPSAETVGVSGEDALSESLDSGVPELDRVRKRLDMREA